MIERQDPNAENDFSNREPSESAIESYEASHGGHDDHGDTTVVFGRTLPFPLYTVVFLGLGVLTIIEVLVGGFEGFLRIPLLLGIAVVKMYLVVYYYMHLKTDSRFFAIALIVPVVVAAISMFFVLATPHSGY